MKKIKAGGVFEGLIFVLTGTLVEMKRSEVKTVIESNGGKVSSSVSKKTNYILAGSDPGSKVDKGKVLGIKILSESDFQTLMRK